MTLTFACTFQDSPLEKTIEIDKSKCQRTSGVQDEIADNLELTKKQFEIVNLPKKLSTKKENKIEIKIRNVCEDVVFSFPKKRTILIESCNKMKFEELMDNIKSQGIYFSNHCLVNDLQFILFGMDIPFEDYCFSCVPKGKVVKVQMNGNIVILEYRGFQFILSENQTVKTAIKLIKQKLENCKEIYLTDILHEKLEDNIKLRKKDNKNYLIEAKQKFFFVSILSGQKNTKKMDFLATVEEAKQYLATTNSFEVELSPDDILIFDKNKKKLKEKEKPLISIKSDDDTIFYDIPKLNEKIKKKEEEQRRRAEAKRAKEKAEELKREKELKKAKDKKTKDKVDDSENSNAIRIVFVFESKGDLNFESDIQVSSSIEEIKKMITSLYSIEYEVIIKYKVRNTYIYCEGYDKINDIKKFLYQKGEYRLFVEIDERKKIKKPATVNKKIKLTKKVACNDDDDYYDESEDDKKKIDQKSLKKINKRKMEEEESTNDEDEDEEEVDLHKFDSKTPKKISKSQIKKEESTSDEDEEIDFITPVDPKSEKQIKKEFDINKILAENARLREENELLHEKMKRFTNSTSRAKSELEILTQSEINSLNDAGNIGYGSQSVVKKVTKMDEYALKILKTSTNTLNMKTSEIKSEVTIDIRSVRNLLQEYEILHQLQHPNIVESFGFCFGDEEHAPSILLQFCPHNLCDVVGDMTDIEKVCSIYEISAGMAAVHAANLIHRDLKPANILIDSKKHVRVSDFGVSCFVSVESQTNSMTSGIGTLKFMAPELLNEAHKYSNKVDVYSFGVVIFFILTGGKIPNITLAEQVTGKKAKIPPEFNEISCNLINSCWSLNAEDRPSFNEIVEYIKINEFKMIDGVDDNISDIRKFLSI